MFRRLRPQRFSRSRSSRPRATLADRTAPTVSAQTTPAQNQTTLDDQVELALTVYNSDIALVRDVRNLQLRAGHVEPSVHGHRGHGQSGHRALQVAVGALQGQRARAELRVQTSSNRTSSCASTSAATSRSFRLVQRNGATQQEEVKARLLSYNNAPVWQIGSEIVTGLHADHIRFPELPGNLYSRPTLIWTLDNDGTTRHRVEASYLAGKLSWNADYVLTVARDDKSGDIDGWVTLTNGSGTSFPNAKLQFVAGDLNRVKQVLGRMAMSESRSDVAAAAPMAQESFSDYHLYTLGRKTTINNNQTKQVSMLGGTGFPLVKRYVVEGQQFYYRNVQHPGAPIKDVVQVFYQFKNEERSGLGMPMPAGVVRVYQSDSSGGTQFVGEDRIDHTPKDETLNLKIGNAFDVVAERKQIDFEKIAANTYEVEYEITVRNHKSVPVAVEVNEPLGGTWRMLRSSHESTKTAAWAAQFQVPVAANGSATLNYRVRVTY